MIVAYRPEQNGAPFQRFVHEYQDGTGQEGVNCESDNCINVAKCLIATWQTIAMP